MFITNPILAKLVHFQVNLKKNFCFSFYSNFFFGFKGYPSDQIKPLIYSVPSMHICLDFIPQMLASNELDTQVIYLI
jgi:hypothetical protein